jgi:hypothetical protein
MTQKYTYVLVLIAYVLVLRQNGTMSLTASKLRENIYKILDQVAETGIPVEIIRKGKRLKIVSQSPVDQKASKLSLLVKHNVMKCPPEELVHLDWSEEWKASE